VQLASDQGLQIAREVQRLSEQPTRPLRGTIAARLSWIDLPLEDPPSREELEQRRVAGGPPGFNAESQLARLDAGKELLTAIRYPIQSFTIGEDLHSVFLAGEICVDYALELKRALDGERIWLHGYSNDFCGYIPSERLLREGGYGGGAETVYFDLPNILRPGMEAAILDEVRRQTPGAFRVAEGTQGIAPRSPEDSLLRMQTHERLRVELVAAEPLIADPVAIDFGPDGRLWVAQMPDYTREVNDEFTPQGVVRVLSDDDGDGDFDRGLDFLDGLRFPTDVKVWRDGVLVCDAPEILFAADRDGDGKAEIREVVVSGFATHNPHARVNSLRLGLDGWLYGSGGLFGGELRLAGGEPVDASNRDFRVDFEAGRLEAVTGATQQGRARDDWDQWFGCTNSELLLHYPVVESYARRNPNVAPPPTIVPVPSPAHGQRLFPPHDLVLFQLSGAPGRPTSACSVEIYRDQSLGEEYYGDAFVCEPVNQLVHRMQLTRAGTTFVGDRADTETDREFLVSTDRWFRPVQVRTGPDGALWVVDMYRYVIEHPRWIPPETI
jgi:putative membrane-bound dehydrogenase-like protein